MGDVWTIAVGPLIAGIISLVLDPFATAAEFFSLVKNKDRKIQKAYDSWLQLVGAHLANVQLNYNTDCIILSGGVMKSIDLFLEDLKKIVDAFIAPYPIKKVNFVNATFDQDAGLLGGASLALF